MPAPGARHLSFLLLLATALASCVARAADPLAIAPPFGVGPYSVGCNNLSQDFTRVQAGGELAARLLERQSRRRSLTLRDRSVVRSRAHVRHFGPDPCGPGSLWTIRRRL